MTQDSPGASRAPFPTTSWTLIRQAQAAMPDARRAILQSLLRRYWKPVYAWFRSQGKSREDAEDLVQGFLNRLVVNDSLLAQVVPGRRFRSWVRVCARNYLIDESRRGKSLRRMPEAGILSFADLQSADGRPWEPADTDDAFSAVWRRELLDRAMRRLEQTCDDAGRSSDLRLFLDYYLTSEDTPPTWAELAERANLAGWQQAARRAHWVRQQLANAIREEVRSYVDDESEIDDEICALLG